jgi:hypothetical protein
MNTYKAQIKSNPSKVMTKSNGSEYVLVNAEILDGPAKGAIVAATRTTKNADGQEKEIPAIGTEVTVYHTALESSAEPGKYVHFFEVSTGTVQTSNDELTALLGANVTVGQAI